MFKCSQGDYDNWPGLRSVHLRCSVYAYPENIQNSAFQIQGNKPARLVKMQPTVPSPDILTH